MTTDQLADHIVRAYSGPMWHGPALEQLLRDVTPDQAATYPVPGAHSIWELVLHASVWAEISAARLRGESLEYPPPHEDWPPPSAPSADEWTAAIDRLRASYLALATRSRELPADELRQRVTGQDHPVWSMLHGVVEHACYHAGQIAILKRALAAAPQPRA